MIPDIVLYTDGSSLGNPGPGGYGIILEWVGKNYRKEFSQGYRYTTNNRMELMAVIVGLETLKQKPCNVLVVSDSRYVVDAVTKKWVLGWEKKNFKNKKNPDLWRRYLRIARKHQLEFQWVKGHNEHPQNERCDALAQGAAKSQVLEIDENYEKTNPKL
ncbi:MAG: ribonuclease HI [Flavobacteriaceae bacterium]